MTGKLDLFNQSLGLLGIEALTSPDAATREADACRTHFQHSLDWLLMEHPWGCTMQRRTLAEIANPDPSGWDYAYQLPTDPPVFRVLSLLDEDSGAELAYPWKKEGSVLLTNASPAYILYQGRVEVEDLDTHVAEVLKFRLAAAIAFFLTQSLQLEQQRSVQYAQLLSYAKDVEGSLAASQATPPVKWEEIG